MTTPAKLNELHQAEEPARFLLERLGWTSVPREALASERSEEREVLLKGRLRAALLRLNEWLTQAQAERVIFDLEHVNEVGIARNQKIHEYLTFGLPLTVNTARGQDSRNVRLFDFDNPGDGLNEFVVTTQFRVRRGNERGDSEDDTRVIKPDLVRFVNGIPLVVMEAKSPSLMDVWKSRLSANYAATKRPGRNGTAPALPNSSTTTCCASPIAGPPRPMPPPAHRRIPTSSGSPLRHIPKTRYGRSSPRSHRGRRSSS